MIPESFRPWINDISERMQVPAEMIFVPALVSLGSIVGRKLSIRPKRHDDFTVVPNLWGEVVLPPGWLKSPALKQALRPLLRLEHEAHEAYLAEKAAWEAKSIIRTAKERKLKKQVDGAIEKGRDN